MGQADGIHGSVSSKRKSIFQGATVDYYRREGRKDLPWRTTDDPWKILLSEMLLRKTTARQVAEVYPIIASKTPAELAEMPRQKLEEILEPLGIQKERSRLMKEVASIVQESDKDIFRDREKLLSLPGIGQYSANAVLCFAYGKRVPALDRNMIRVLNRVFSFESKRSRPHTDPHYWEFARSLVPAEAPDQYNWGILDIAARICRPRNPQCSECPLLQVCDYGQKRLDGGANSAVSGLGGDGSDF